jgi:lipopolysaccharide/colanic/teichoic acid biosynthesis glycosyltransferase
MGQEAQFVKCAEKKTAEVALLNGGLSDSGQDSQALSEQQFYSNVTFPEPSDIRQVSPAQTTPFNEVLIRAVDIAGSVLLFLLTAPVMVLTALLIKLSSAGPVLYRQKRVGKAGKIFTLYKFRTMVDGAEKQTGPVWAKKDDDRVTMLGRLLRSTRLDELPQLFNVLLGDMSLVGPRPERPYFVRRHRVLQGVRLTVRPGITGLAQIRAFYDLRPEHKLKYDYLYIQKRSLLLNLYILLQTIPVVFLKRGW